MASPNTLKRTYAEAGLDHPTYDQSSPAHFQSLASTLTFESSQSFTSSQNPLAPHHSNTASEGFNSAGAIIPHENIQTASEPVVKKAKLTFAEKEVKRIEREFKDRQKAEEKAKREEEKAKKEEERLRREAEKEAEKARREEDKRTKDAEKEEKRRVKEEQARMRQEEKKQKEDERQRKEEEKNKKARVGLFKHLQVQCRSLMVLQSQLRLNAFFVQPSVTNRAPSGSPARDGPSPLSSRRSSISEINAMEAEARHRSCSISSTPRKPRLPDYERSFPTFFVQSHTTLAPNHRFCRNEEGLCYVQEKIDEALLQSQKANDTSKEIAFHPHNLLQVSPHQSHRCPPSVMSVKDIVAEIDSGSHNPIDLTESQLQRATKRPLDLLKSIPVKILKFAEDVRPPYIGTYTRLQDPRTISRLARNPFRRELPETNYDYDSEAEWEEPGEGEDLDSEGEEEIEDEDEADMEGFLDDEETDARAVKRRPILGDLEPTCSGLCWEGPQAQGSDNPTIDLLMFKLDILMGKHSLQDLYDLS